MASAQRTTSKVCCGKQANGTDTIHSALLILHSSSSSLSYYLQLTIYKHFRLKQKFPQSFKDICLYTELCGILSRYNVRLPLRRFIQELFLDLTFDEVHLLKFIYVFMWLDVGVIRHQNPFSCFDSSTFSPEKYLTTHLIEAGAPLQFEHLNQISPAQTIMPPFQMDLLVGGRMVLFLLLLRLIIMTMMTPTPPSSSMNL